MDTSSSTSAIVERKCDDTSTKISLRNRIIGFSDWLKQLTESKSTPSKVLDLRCTTEQEKRQLRSSSFIPVEYLKERSFELPARHVEFTILVSDNDLGKVESLLCGSKNGRQKPWKVAHVLLDTEDFWNEASQNIGMVVVQQQQQQQDKLDNESSIIIYNNTSGQRLWQPDPMVENILFPLLVKAKNNDNNNNRIMSSSPSSNTNSSEIWDLASGSGRDIAFLAENLYTTNPNTDYKLIAIDHRYNAKETKIVNDFFDRRGVGNQTSSMKLNLSNWTTLEQTMSSNLLNNYVAAMFCVRFWKLELVEAIANSQSISSGVLFGLSHFCKATIGAPWNYDHPSEKTVLERDQLFNLFQAQWDIVYNEIALDSDHGRTMIHFVARRR
jgi:hypothetical protein